MRPEDPRRPTPPPWRLVGAPARHQPIEAWGARSRVKLGPGPRTTSLLRGCGAHAPHDRHADLHADPRIDRRADPHAAPHAKGTRRKKQAGLRAEVISPFLPPSGVWLGPERLRSGTTLLRGLLALRFPDEPRDPPSVIPIPLARSQTILRAGTEPDAAWRPDGSNQGD